MSYKSESRFRNHLIATMKEEGFEVQAIESGTMGNGIPDLFFARYDPSISGWMELKNICDDILPENIKIDFRSGQLEWLHKFHKAGIDVYLGISCNEGIFIFRNDEIKASYSIQDFLTHKHLKKMKDIGGML